MGLSIIKGSSNLDLAPNATIQRERNSPAFLQLTEDGKDGIPGEVSYPFTLPLSDNNIRLLGFPDQLAATKTLNHDITLEDSGMPLSAGKLIINGVSANLSKNNVGSIDSHILSNISEFWQRVKNKKLSDLNLGGLRTFQWSGYSTSIAGFWKHVHDTWSYTSADQGDYVFDPIFCKTYKRTEEDETWINKWGEYDGVIEMDRTSNYYTLCPQPYLVFILKCIFTEHSYSIEGDVMNDPDFKQICFESFRAVTWVAPQLSGPVINPTVEIKPKAQITIDLREHVPPAMTVGELLVEVQKLIPVAFVIDDRKRTCRLVKLSDTAKAGHIDRTKSFSSGYTLSFEKKDAANLIYGFERDDSNPAMEIKTDEDLIDMGQVASFANLPTANSSNLNHLYYVEQVNGYYACVFWEINTMSGYGWERKDHNVGSYLPGDQTNTITSNLSVSAIEPKLMELSQLFSTYGYFIVTEREGNWQEGNAQEFTPWPPTLFFHRGRYPFSLGPTQTAPLATNSIWNFNSSYPNNNAPKVGNWSLSYKVGTGNYGLIDYWWSNWLPVLETNEKIKGRLFLKFHEYLNFDWDTVIMINNTLYLPKKINEVLPYPGYIDIEAMRVK